MVLEFKIEKVPNKPRIVEESNEHIVIDLGEGAELKATYLQAGFFKFVVIDWFRVQGFPGEAMFWWKSWHSLKWRSYPIVPWCEKYEGDKLGEFLKDFSEFKRLFKEKELLGTFFEELDCLPKKVRNLMDSQTFHCLGYEEITKVKQILQCLLNEVKAVLEKLESQEKKRGGESDDMRIDIDGNTKA